MKRKTETPITDASVSWDESTEMEYVPAEICRSLELQNAQLRKNAEEIQNSLRKSYELVEEMRRQRDSATDLACIFIEDN